MKKKIRIEDRALLDSVMLQPCAACGRKPPSDPHHLTTRGAGGDDTVENVVPLCRFHHTEYHKSGPGRMIEKYASFKLWLEKMERHDLIERSKRSYRT